jgi:hypothetical protein
MKRGTALASVWEEPPQMDRRAPQPDVQLTGDSLLVAYRTHRGDHFAVVRFSGVASWKLEPANDELEPSTFHEIREPVLTSRGLRRWVVTFHDDTLDVSANDATVLVRAVQARDAHSALAMVQV